MKIFQSVTVTPERCPGDLYRHIVQMKPEGQRGTIFHVEAKPGDEDSARLIIHIAALCKERGLDKVPGAYSHLMDRVYEPGDFETAPLLLLETQRKLFQNAEVRDTQGRLSLLAGQAKQSVKVASVYPRPWIVVSDAVRRALEPANFIGLEFGDVIVRGKSRVTQTGLFWELRSGLTLPKMANSILCGHSPSPAYGIIDPPFHTVEPHYRATDLHQLGVFDIARTFEPLGCPQQHLIISPRFYKHCLLHKIWLRVRPVRVDLK